MENDDLERALFEVPKNVEFPIELNHHLKMKLHGLMQENSFLKRHVTYLDKEVIKLRKDAVLRQQKDADTCDSKDLNDVLRNQAPSIMASKIIQLGKAKRYLTAQLESLKTQCRDLGKENEMLRRQRSSDQAQDPNNDPDNAGCDLSNIDKAEEGELQATRKLNCMTKKMLEYRRQCQQMSTDLKVALRALSKEIGNSSTPRTVLRQVAGSWRGRQQQIVALQQKVTELQIKAKIKDPKDSQTSFSWDQDMSHFGDGDSGGLTKRVGSMTSVTSVSSVVSASTRMTLMEKDMKKQEQIDRLSHNLEKVTHDLKNRQQEVRAGKARIETLETQVSSYKSQVELLEIKLQEKKYDNKDILHEIKLLKLELTNINDREKQNKSKNTSEVEEAKRALARERAIVSKLQDMVNEKQAALKLAEVDRP